MADSLKKQTEQSKWNQLQEWLKNRHSQLAHAILLVVAACIIVGWQIPSVQDALVGSGVLQLLILVGVLDLSVTMSKMARSSTDLASISSDLRNEPSFVSRITRGHAGDVSILALTGLNALPVVRQLVEAGWNVKLLIKNPYTFSARSGEIEAQATIERISAEKKLADKVEIRIYDGDPAMHGVLFPDIAVVGWLGQSVSKSMARYHEYPMVLAEGLSPTGRPFHQMLSTEIEEVWSAGKASTSSSSSN